VREEMMTERTDEIQASGRAGAVSAGRAVPKNTNPQPLHAYHNHTITLWVNFQALNHTKHFQVTLHPRRKYKKSILRKVY